jgi:hypothetical protein
MIIRLVLKMAHNRFAMRRWPYLNLKINKKANAL